MYSVTNLVMEVTRMTETEPKEARYVKLVEEVRKAIDRAGECEKNAEGDMGYNYWKGVAHGLQQAWDILEGF